MDASAVRRFVKIAGRNASISVENEFWDALREIAGYRDVTLSDLVTVIDSEQRIGTLASAILLPRSCFRAHDAPWNATDVGHHHDCDDKALGLRRSASASVASQAVGLSIENSGRAVMPRKSSPIR